MNNLSNAIKTQRIIDVLALIIYFLSVAHIYFRAQPVELFYLIIISLLFSILFILIRFTIREESVLISKHLPLVIFLSTYAMLLIWLGIIRVIPEYKDIEEFEKRQFELIYSGLNDEFDKIELARLYMNSPHVIERIQPGVHHKGNMIMHNFLKEKIKIGEGEDYIEDIYLLAEVGFVYSGKGYAYSWYKKAYDFGEEKALSRYEQRLAEYGLTKEMVLQ